MGFVDWRDGYFYWLLVACAKVEPGGIPFLVEKSVEISILPFKDRSVQSAIQGIPEEVNDSVSIPINEFPVSKLPFRYNYSSLGIWL